MLVIVVVFLWIVMMFVRWFGCCCLVWIVSCVSLGLMIVFVYFESWMWWLLKLSLSRIWVFGC